MSETTHGHVAANDPKTHEIPFKKAAHEQAPAGQHANTAGTGPGEITHDQSVRNMTHAELKEHIQTKVNHIKNSTINPETEYGALWTGLQDTITWLDHHGPKHAGGTVDAGLAKKV